MRLAQRDELRLLDEALEEARARPRPPQATYAAPPVPVRPRAIAAAVNPPPVRRRVEDRRSNGQVTVPPEVDADEFVDHEEPYLDAEDGAAEVDRDPPARRRRIDIADVLAFSETIGEDEPDPDRRRSGSTVDRKRLLAAIICILQEELTKSK
ncbi:MAG TPA: hypothetical protein VFZ01_07520 [Geminicoccaceae bacterium]